MAKNVLSPSDRYALTQYIDRHKEDFSGLTIAEIAKDADTHFDFGITRGHITGVLKVIPVEIRKQRGPAANTQKMQQQIKALAQTIYELYSQINLPQRKCVLILLGKEDEYISKVSSN